MERILRAVEITPLPAAPEIVPGVVNVQGRVMAVANIRKRFGLAERPPALSDQMIVARTPKRSVVLVVDAVTGVLEYSEHEALAAPAIVPGMRYLAGVVKLADGMVLINDLAGFLSLDEERRLDEALWHA